MLEWSDETDQILPALVAATLGVDEISLDGTASIVSRKGDASSFRYRYATLREVNSAVRKPLAQNGLIIAHGARPMLTGDRQWVVVRTELRHVSGQWCRNDLPVQIFGGDPKEVGIGVSYAKRYNILALLNLSPGEDEDDDADEISRRRMPKQEPPKATPRKTDQPVTHARPQEPSRAAAAPMPAVVAASPTIGRIVEVGEKGGALFVKLATGFVAATRDAELKQALAAYHASNATIEIVPGDWKPGKTIPTIVEIQLRKHADAAPGQ